MISTVSLNLNPNCKVNHTKHHLKLLKHVRFCHFGKKKICLPSSFSSRCGRTIPSRPLLWLLELSLVESKISDSLLTVSSSHCIPSWTPPSPASKASILSLLVANNRALIPMLSPSQSSWNKDKVYSSGENIPHCLEQFSDILYLLKNSRWIIATTTPPPSPKIH